MNIIHSSDEDGKQKKKESNRKTLANARTAKQLKEQQRKQFLLLKESEFSKYCKQNPNNQESESESEYDYDETLDEV